MEIKILKLREALKNKAFYKIKPTRVQFDNFKANLIQLLELSDDTDVIEHETFHQNLIIDFLNKTYYDPIYYINSKQNTDLVIYNGLYGISDVGVIIEVKRPGNDVEMMKIDKINVKAFHELILYYLRERKKNSNIKHLIITNVNEWFIFDVTFFETNFAQNKKLIKQFNDFENKSSASKKTRYFYKQIVKPFIEKLNVQIKFIHFNLQDYRKLLYENNKTTDKKIIEIFKIFSPDFLLKLPFVNDSNSLDKCFYIELLHIIGLTEIKDKSKKLIKRYKKDKRNYGSLIEDTIIQLHSLERISRLKNPNQFGEKYEDQLFNVALDLCITWINRILFLKLLEAQLINYNNGDKSYLFLNFDKIKNYGNLNTLFFQVLAKKHSERDDSVKVLFEKIPYLNSSLFEQTEIEKDTLVISNLTGNETIPIISSTVLKDESGRKKTGKLCTLEYLFEFFNAYNFTSQNSEKIQKDNKTLINASVLGLIFEKINGYKDGSFFTPGFITMYMCRETIRKAIIQKFNETKKWNCENIIELYNKIGDSKEDKKEANNIVNSLTICDPAVGSGHFLVSALNEIISIKHELKILMDSNGKRLGESKIKVINDELIIRDENNKLFEYNPQNEDSQRIQETLFHEKKIIIENCLFGVDINPNSVKICRLRLWIELLKNAYYKNKLELETLPNIDINIKCGNSLISRYTLNVDLKQALKQNNCTITDYKNAISKYINADNKKQKKEMEEQISNIKSNLKFVMNNNDPKRKDYKKIENELFHLKDQIPLFELNKKEKSILDKKMIQLEQKQEILSSQIYDIESNKIFINAFEWRYEFPKILNDDGDFIGFDIIIGNPPWGTNLTANELEYIKKQNKDIVVRTIDTFMFFINLNFTIKSKLGLICQIIPDVMLYQGDNIKLRQKILDNYQLLIIANLGDHIFEDVARPSCIIQIGNKSYKSVTKVLEYKKSNNIIINDIIPEEIDTRLFSTLYNSIFATRNFEGYKILNRFNENTLSELIDSDGIQRGITPTLKKAFIIDDLIIKEYLLEINYIFPTITGGRDVSKFLAKDIGKRIIYTKKSDNAVNLKNIINYISKFESLIKSKEVKDGKYPFWVLHRARNKFIFEKEEKIIGVITGDKISVSFDNCKLYPTDGMYIFASNKIYSNYFLIGLLNSKLLTYFYRLMSMEENRTLAQIKLSVIKNLPVSKKFNQELVKKIENRTEEIINRIKNNNPIDNSVLCLDQLVYQLYNLTQDEIKIIEKI